MANGRIRSPGSQNWVCGLSGVIHALQPLRLLNKLVAIPTPSGKEYNGSIFLERYLKQRGIHVVRQQVGEPRRFNLVASIGRNNAYPRILFNSHIDTVPAFAKSELRPTVKKAFLHGRGTCDAKGSVAAMTIAFLALAAKPIAEQPNLTLAIMVGEENSGDGVARFVRNRRNFTWAVVGEPTNLAIANTQSGYVELAIQTTSPPCHGFDPSAEQAIVPICALIEQCRRLVDDLSRRFSHHIFVRFVKGGSEDAFWYTRPSCQAKVLINIYPDSTRRMVVSQIRQYARQLEARYRGTRFTISLVDWDNGFMTGSESTSVRALSYGLNCARKRLRMVHLPSWTDGSTLNAMGIPTVIFGPGRLRDAHSKVERVCIDQVELAARILAAACVYEHAEKRKS